MTPRQCGIAARAHRHRLTFIVGLWTARSRAFFFLTLLVLATAGCAKHKVLVLPLTFNPSMARAPQAMQPPELLANPPQDVLATLLIPPARPRRPVVRSSEVAATPAVEPVSPKPVPPRISMRLSPAEESDYRQRTSQAIAVAERHLQSVNSSTLSVPQQDLVEKIRGFLSQSREAMRSADWLRAHSLAQKAQVLSEELISRK